MTPFELLSSIRAEGSAEGFAPPLQWMLRLSEDAAGRVLQELPPMPPRQLLSLVPPRLHAAALRAQPAERTAVLDLTACGGLEPGHCTVTAADVLCAASRDAPITAVALTEPLTADESVSTCQAVAALPLQHELRSVALRVEGGPPGPLWALWAAAQSSIARLTQITQLSVSGRHCADLLLLALPQLPQLHQLNARHALLDARVAGRLAPVLARVSALTALDISGNPLGACGWCALAHAGLPARLAALDARETFHASGDGGLCEGVTLPLPGERQVPESLHFLKQALRACGRLQRLAVGPTSAHLNKASESALVEWGTMSDRLATVSDLTGAGGFDPKLKRSFPALTRLQWASNVIDAPDVPYMLSSLAALEALHLTYTAEGGGLEDDANVVAMFRAAGALSGLKSLSLHFDINDNMFIAESGLQALIEHLLPCVALRELDLQLRGDALGSQYDHSGAQLLGIRKLTALQTLSLRIGSHSRDADGFQLSPDEGLACAPMSLRRLTLEVVMYAAERAGFNNPIRCSMLTSLRLEAVDPVEELPFSLPRMADALGYHLSQLRALRELQLRDELHEPYVLAALAALPQLTALEVLRVRSDMAGFPGRVVEALAGRTALRQLTIVHESWSGVEAEEVVMALGEFSWLERVGLCETTSQGAALRKGSFRILAHVLARLPRLALAVLQCDAGDWERAQSLVSRRVQLASDRRTARDFVDGEWDI